MRFYLVLFVFLALTVPAFACDKCEVAVRVLDGDTVVIMQEGQYRQVHLVSVDAPQMEQPYGKKAKDFTENLLLNHVVTIRYIDGSRASDIVSSDGKSLKWGLIRAGLAWYPENHAENSLRNVSDKVGKYERKARRSRKGLWAQDNPCPPWDIHRGTEALPEVMTAFGNITLGGIIG